MDRREFNGGVMGWLGAAALPASLVSGCRSSPVVNGARPAGSGLRVDGPRMLAAMERLARVGATPDGGIHRVAFGDADLQARRLVMAWMREAGMTTRVDAAGNVIGRVGGSQPGLAPIAMGSHVDSVPRGGIYDGSLGVLGAIEIVKALRERGHRTRHPLEVIVFSNEENGKTGSRAMIGEVDAEQLARTTYVGSTVADGLRRVGGDPDQLARARLRPGAFAAFLELHIEQGGILDREGDHIGVVEGIVGICRWSVVFDGFANHAGTTPMDQRRDALLSAAQFVQAVHEIARSTRGPQVATVGQIRAFPGAPNVVPGRAELSLEIRDLAMPRVDGLFERIAAEGRKIATGRGTEFAAKKTYTSRAAPTHERLQGAVGDAATALGLSIRQMPSGAGHDSQSLADLCPIGMVFVPSVGGISHSPKEYTAPADLVRGTDVLLQALLRSDEMEL